MSPKISKKPADLRLLQREYIRIQRKITRLQKAAQKEPSETWMKSLEKRLPPKAVETLQKSFSTAFALVFEKGTGLIEKSCSCKTLEESYKLQSLSLKVHGVSVGLRHMKGQNQLREWQNVLLSTVEGVGLGVLGIGLPDIVLFLGMLLRGTYQTALSYGFDYKSLPEKYWILVLLQTALTTGETRLQLDAQIDQWIQNLSLPTPGEIAFQKQREQTAETFSMSLLVCKFIQGLPIAGILGGLSNPFYYQKIMTYVQLRYQQRYLQTLQKSLLSPSPEK